MRRPRPGLLLLALGADIATASAQPVEEASPTPPPAAPPAVATPSAENAEPATPPTAPAATVLPEAATGDSTTPAPAPSAKPSGLPCLDTPEGCKIEDFKTPTSPAFALIGISPSQVETPRSPRDLGFALYDAYNGGALGQNVALDVAPYWLIAHPTLTYDQYIERSLVRQFLDNLSVSVATAAAPEQSATDVGFGLRTHVFFADASDVEAEQALRNAEDNLMGLQAAVALKEQLSRLGCEQKPELDICSKLRKLQQQTTMAAEEALKKAAKAVQDTFAARSGFRIGLAGAVAFRSAADRFKPNDFRKAAGWINAGYRGKMMELTGLVRFTSVDSERRLQLIDLGARVGVFRSTWALSAEAMYRAVSGVAPPMDNSLRWAGTFEFKVTDGVFVSATYGKDADDEIKSGQTFALFGLSFQAGDRKLIRR